MRTIMTLLGTGSSGGVPRLGNNWGACDPKEPRNRRSRCSVLLEAYADGERATSQATNILIDTSPDMRDQLNAANCCHLDAVVFTHDHADQTHGLDDIRQFVLLQRQQMPVFMDQPTTDTLTRKFKYCFEGSKGYPAILKQMPTLQAYEAFAVSGRGPEVSILPLDQDHGAIRSLGFRIGGLAYCNDLRALPEASKARLLDLDVLVIDALRYTPHPTHMSVSQALETIEELKPRRALLTNLHVDLDYQTLKRELPPSVEPAYDGMTVSAIS